MWCLLYKLKIPCATEFCSQIYLQLRKALDSLPRYHHLPFLHSNRQLNQNHHVKSPGMLKDLPPCSTLWICGSLRNQADAAQVDVREPWKGNFHLLQSLRSQTLAGSSSSPEWFGHSPLTLDQETHPNQTQGPWVFHTSLKTTKNLKRRERRSIAVAATQQDQRVVKKQHPRRNAY